jgi:hypothetical protein
VPRSQSGVIQQADAERQQHRGDRDIADPHRYQRADDENTEQDAVGTCADAQQHEIGQPRAES